MNKLIKYSKYEKMNKTLFQNKTFQNTQGDATFKQLLDQAQTL